MVPVVYVINYLKAIFKHNFSKEISFKSFVYTFVTSVFNYPIFSNSDLLLLYFRFSKKAFVEELGYTLHFTLTTTVFFLMIFIGFETIKE